MNFEIEDKVLSCRQVFAGYGDRDVITELSFEVRKGETVGIIGPNGAGKTTLMKVMAGLIKPRSGAIYFQDKPQTEWNSLDLARQIAYIAQRQTIYFPFRAEEVVMMGRIPHQRHRYFDSQEDWDAVQRAMMLTNTEPLRGRYYSDLSGGEQQLVVLASALAQEPQLLLLDEPTNFLDLKHQLQILDILRQLHGEKGTTLMLVTHDLNLAEEFCSRLLVLGQGRLVADLTSSQDDMLRLPVELIESVFQVQARNLPEQRIQVSYSGKRPS